MDRAGVLISDDDASPEQPSSRLPWFESLKPLALAEILILIVAALYSMSVAGGYLWDDKRLLFFPSSDDSSAPAALLSQLRGIWTGNQVDYFPLTSTLLLIESWLWGDAPAGYHVVTIALHASAVVLLWLTLRRLEVRGAWLGALLFAVHPLSVESVAWIAETKNTLCLAFCAAALLAYFRFEDRPKAGGYLLSLGLFILSLLAKTASVMLPFVLLLCAWWRRGRIGRKDLARSLPFFAASLGLGLVTLRMTASALINTGYAPSGTPWERVLEAGRFALFYLSKAVWPQGLMTIYPRFAPAGIGPDLAVIAAVLALWLMRRQVWARSALFALAYYLLSLAPALGFFKMAFSVFAQVADRFQYFGLIGITALAGAAIASLPQGFALGLAAAGMMTWSSFALQSAYYSEETLWRQQLQMDPRCVTALDQLGNLLLRQDRMEEAGSVLNQAVEIDPGNWYARFDLGQLLMHTGRPAQALAQFETANRLQPGWPAALAYIGRADAELGKTDEAEAWFRRSLQVAPGNATVHRDLGQVLEQKGRLEEAAQELREALRLNPRLTGAREKLNEILKLLE